MLVLDTNHLREFELGTPTGDRLMKRLDDAGDEITTTIVSLEEQFRGWLAEIRRHDTGHLQIMAYQQFQEQIEKSARWTVLPWDADSVRRFADFRRQGVRISTLDLKIACITLAHDATLLTRNAVDFAKVPGLRFENWLD